MVCLNFALMFAVEARTSFRDLLLYNLGVLDEILKSYPGVQETRSFSLVARNDY